MVPAMRLLRHRVAAIVAATVLAAPASATAQGAGDEQYQDPFAGEDQGQSQQGGGTDGGEGSEPAPPPAPATSESEVQAPAPETTAADPVAPAAQSQLPRTGVDAGAIVLAGAILLAGGVALRFRVRERR
jgi:LPXTG-motif cell wall-anchored protein